MQPYTYHDILIYKQGAIMKEHILELVRQIINRATREYLSQYHDQEWDDKSEVIFSFEDWLFNELENGKAES
jgi:hypothetical protein